VGDYLVSTVFIGFDPKASEQDIPMLFETMIFKGKPMRGIGYIRCCATLEKAKEMHQEALRYLEKELGVF